MYLVDSHCHLDLLDLNLHAGRLENVLENAFQQGVKHFLCVSVTLRDFPNLLQIAKRYPEVSASVGLHPNEEEAGFSSEVLMQYALDEKIVAIGETGLDYYRSEGDLEWQRERFRQHIRVAKKVNKPLIIHSRQAKEDTLKILQEEDASAVGGVMHCFTEDSVMAEQVLELGFYISFSGIVTFANAKSLQQVAEEIPLDRLLVETDSPYLAPVPYRGKPNEPALVRFVAEYLARLRNVPLEIFARQTTENFFTCFKGAKKNV